MRTSTKVALGLFLLVATAAGGALCLIGPRNVIGMARYDQRKEGRLRPGDRAPDVTLVSLDGAQRRLSAHIGPRPLVLIFGSFT